MPRRVAQQPLRLDDSRRYLGKRRKIITAFPANKGMSRFDRPLVAMPNGTNGTCIDAEVIRRNCIEPAVRNGEWSRAASAAGNGWETGGG